MRFTLSRKSSPCRGFKFLSTELKSANISTDSRGTRVQLRACRENCHHLVNVTLSAYQLRPKSTDQSGPWKFSSNSYPTRLMQRTVTISLHCCASPLNIYISQNKPKSTDQGGPFYQAHLLYKRVQRYCVSNGVR